MIKTIGQHDALYQSLISTVLQGQMQDHEFTVADFANDAQMPETSARRRLRAKLKAGELSKRDAVKDGHQVVAYRINQK